SVEIQIDEFEVHHFRRAAPGSVKCFEHRAVAKEEPVARLRSVDKCFHRSRRQHFGHTFPQLRRPKQIDRTRIRTLFKPEESVKHFERNEMPCDARWSELFVVQKPDVSR